MRGSILKRLEIMEHAINAGGEIPDKEKVVVVVCPDGATEQFEKLKQEKLEPLKEKYGVIPDDLLVIWVRQFFRKAAGECV